MAFVASNNYKDIITMYFFKKHLSCYKSQSYLTIHTEPICKKYQQSLISIHMYTRNMINSQNNVIMLIRQKCFL